MDTGGGGAAAPRPGMPSMLPEDAKYGRRAEFLQSKREWSKFFAQNGGSYGPKAVKTIRFDIVSDKYLDTSEMYFVADIELNARNGTVIERPSLESGLGGTIQRLTITTPGGTLVERIDDYNMVQCILNQAKCAQGKELHRLNNGEFFNVLGTAPGNNNALFAAPAAVADITRAQLSHKILAGFNQSFTKKLLPPNTPFRVEIELVPEAGRCCRAYLSNGNPATIGVITLELKNVSIQMPEVQIMNTAFESAARRLMMQGWQFAGTTYRVYNSSQTALQNTSVNVPDSSVCLTGILALLNVSSHVGSVLHETIYTRQNYFSGLQQCKIGTDVFPKAPYDVAYVQYGGAAASNGKNAEAYNQVIDILGAFPQGDNHVGTLARTAIIGFSVADAGMGSGINTASTNMPVQLVLNSTDFTDPCTLTVICQKTAMFKLIPTASGMMEIETDA